MEFIESQSQKWLTALEETIKNELFESWRDAHADEGPEYLEHRMMSYASEDEQKLYNNHYRLTMEDEYYFVAEDEHEEYIKFVNQELAKLEGREINDEVL
jgi:hypothetical protein